MQDELATYALAQAQSLGASYAEVRQEIMQGDAFILNNGVPKMSAFERSFGLGVRFVVDGGLGFLAINKLQKREIKEALERAVKTAKASSRLAAHSGMAGERAHVMEYAVPQKRKLKDVPAEEKLELLFDIDRHITATGEETSGRYLFFSGFTTKKLFLNSEGSRILSTIPRTEYYHIVTVEKNGKSGQRYMQHGDSGGFEQVQKRNLPETIAAEIRGIGQNLSKGEKLAAGTYDMVLSPEITGIIAHESCGHPYEADRILGREAAQAGESFVEKKDVGSQLGSNVVSVVDDPTLPNSFGYYEYDDEGVKARKKYLMKNGKINELLHNRETASVFGTQSNGSARASAFDREPLIRMSNTYFEPGDFTEDELISDVKNGIYLKNFTEWNIDDKRLNQRYVGLEAWQITDGKLAAPVRAPVLEISTPTLYKSVDAVGNNLSFVAGSCGKGEPMQGMPVWFGGPSIRLRKVRLR